MKTAVRLCSAAPASGRSRRAWAARETGRERGSKSVRTIDIALFIRKTHVDDVDEVVLTHIRAQSMSIAACVTPLLFLFKAFTVFTPSFSLNLGN